MANRRARNRDVFDLVNKVPSGDAGWKKKPIQPPNMDTRGNYGQDPIAGIEDQSTTEQYGQQQFGPGWISPQQQWIINMGNDPSQYSTWGDFSDVTNMSDLYDWYMSSNEYSNTGADFYDWFSNMGPGGVGGDMSNASMYWTGDDPTGGVHPSEWDLGGISWGNAPWNEGFGPGSYQGYMTGDQSSGYGGSQGGFGDLGEGSIFGSDDDFTNYSIDPDDAPDSWCYDAWQASGASDSYDDFAAAMCG